MAAAALFFVTAVSAFSQGAIGSKTVQDFPRPNWKSVPLVVGPGDQLEVDLGWPFLAWESRTGTSHRVEAMDLVTGDRQSPFSPGQRQKYPGLYGDLLVFVSGWTSIGCSTGSCVNFLNLRDGSSSR